MKISNLQINNINTSYHRTNSKNNKNVPFKGALAVNFWDAISRGGFAASFMVQDVTGTCIPRTYQSLNRNKEITHKKNYKAAAETALREFITGPSMVIIPMAVLAGAKKFSGSANDVKMENIAPLSDEMKTVLRSMPIKLKSSNRPFEYAQRAKDNLYERLFALALDEDADKNISDTAKKLARELSQYDEAPKRNIFQQLLNKNIVKEGKTIKAKDQILEGIITQFTDCKKGLDSKYDNLLMTDLKGALKKPNKVSSLFKEFSNFGKDVQKTIAKHTKEGFLPRGGIDYTSFMDEFKYRRTGSKFLTNLLMVAATALFLSQVPKLYSINKTNPETDAFRNEGGEVVRANK